MRTFLILMSKFQHIQLAGRIGKLQIGDFSFGCSLGRTVVMAMLSCSEFDE